MPRLNLDTELWAFTRIRQCGVSSSHELLRGQLVYDYEGQMQYTAVGSAMCLGVDQMSCPNTTRLTYRLVTARFVALNIRILSKISPGLVYPYSNMLGVAHAL